MAELTSAQAFGAAICDALGLKRVLRLQLDLGPKHASVVATVAVGDYGELTQVIRRFELHPEEKAFHVRPANVGVPVDQADGNDAA